MKSFISWICIIVGLFNSIDGIYGDAPNFISGAGITVLATSQINKQLYELVLSSEQVRGSQTIRILLPEDYTTSGPNRRYPTLYLLHGATDDGRSWTMKGAAQRVIGNSPIISIMPNGDPAGFYTNWVIPGDAAPQNWRTYHMEQLVPWVDLNLRTVAKKTGRAIAGNSMGGYGTIHYAERYTNNFVYAASFSGAVDIMDPSLQKMILDALTPSGQPFVGPFGYPNASESTNGWIAENTVNHASLFRNISVALYTGAVGSLELLLRNGTYRLRTAIQATTTPLYFDDYGHGQSIGQGCTGEHSWNCWKGTLGDVLPRMLAVLEQQH